MPQQQTPSQLRTLGLIGGMSWESSLVYYQKLNWGVRQRLGGLASAPLILHSLEFGRVAQLQHDGNWAALEALLVSSAQGLQAAGAEALMIATNTMHKLYAPVAAAVDLPLLHIAEATGRALVAAGCKRPLLLATAFTMEQDFYKGYLERNFDLEVRVPGQDDRAEVHRVIYEELCQGRALAGSKARYQDIVAKDKEADAIIFGCTEIDLLVAQQDFDRPCFDTTQLHVEAGLEAIMGGSPLAA